MISATDALRLPRAQLSAADLRVVEKALIEIETFVRNNMRRNGVHMVLNETNPAVVAEVQNRLRAAGWEPQWAIMQRQSRVQGGEPETVGYQLALQPSAAAYAAAPVAAADFA